MAEVIRSLILLLIGLTKVATAGAIVVLYGKSGACSFLGAALS